MENEIRNIGYKPEKWNYFSNQILINVIFAVLWASTLVSEIRYPVTWVHLTVAAWRGTLM